MAELIATGTTLTNSADFTLAAGASTTLYLKDATGATVPPECIALVQVKSGAEYFNVGQLDGVNSMRVLTAIGTFRVSRLANTSAFGVDRD